MMDQYNNKNTNTPYAQGTIVLLKLSTNSMVPRGSEVKIQIYDLSFGDINTFVPSNAVSYAANVYTLTFTIGFADTITFFNRVKTSKTARLTSKLPLVYVNYDILENVTNQKTLSTFPNFYLEP